MFDITSILSKLRDTDSPFDAGTGEFQRISVENAKTYLDLESRAKECTESGIPTAVSTSKDGMAVEIDSYITEIITLAKDKLIDRLQAIRDLTDQQKIDVSNKASAIFENGRQSAWDAFAYVSPPKFFGWGLLNPSEIWIS